MKCIVTAGPTYESLDQVRRLTNFSTGTLGCTLAGRLQALGHEVLLLKGYYCTFQGEISASMVETFTTTADLQARLQALSTEGVQAIFHAAAVSDFGFGRVFSRARSGELTEIRAGKFTTRDSNLVVELVPTPKIISQLRPWFPEAHLVGWKYEVDGTRTDAVRAGVEQLARCRTNACVVNGPAYGDGFGLVEAGGSSRHVPDPSTLFSELGALLARS